MKRVNLLSMLLLVTGCLDSATEPTIPHGIQANMVPYAEYTLVRGLQDPFSSSQWGFPQMNGSGIVVSGAQDNTGPEPTRYLGVWEDAGPPTLHSLPSPYEFVWVMDLNEGGLATGELSGIGVTPVPFVFDLTTATFDLLPLPEAAISANAPAVDEKGRILVVASFKDPDSGAWRTSSFIYENGVYLQLPNPGGHETLQARDIAPDGTILLTGYTQGPPSSSASFLWRNGNVTPVQLPEGCQAWAAMRHNLMAGICYGPPRQFLLWKNGRISLFGTAEENFTEITDWSRNGAVLPHSETVPYSWVYWPSGKMVAMPEGVSALAINAEGEILISTLVDPTTLAYSIVRLVEGS